MPLVLRLQRLVLTEEVQRQEGLTSVAIEVDFFGLVPDLKTPAIKPKVSGNNVDFEHVIQITTKCPEADVLRRVVQSRDDQDSDIFLTVVASTRTGSKSLGVAFINLKEQSRLGNGKSVTLPVRGPDERSVGTLEVSLDATAAVHRAVGADTLRVDVMELLSYEALRQDTSVAELFVEVDMAGLKDATHLKTKALKKNAAALDFGYSHSVSLAPGSRAQQELQKSLKSGNNEDSDIYFVLKGRTPQGTERELGEAFVNLTDLLRDDADKVRVALPLKSKGGGGPTLMVSVLGVDALRRMGTTPAAGAAGAAQPDALRIDVRDLTLAGPAKGDTMIAKLFVEIDALGLAGKTVLVTPSVKKKGTGPVRFDYSHTLALSDGSAELAKLRTALMAKDEQDSDVYFTVKTRDPRGDVHELGQGFVNLEQMSRENKDKDGSVDVVSPKGAVIVASLNVSISALGAMRRARAFKPAAAADAVRVEVAGLALSSAVQQDASVTEVWVEVDLLDLASAAQLRTKPQRKTASALDFGYSHSVSVAPGSRAQQALQKALRSRDEQESDVYFSLKTREGRRRDKELGQGYVSLLKLARDGRNLVSEQVTLQGPMGASVGTLTVSVLAAETLQAALGTAAAPAKPAPRPIRLQLHVQRGGRIRARVRSAKPAPPKVAYHPNVRCRRGAGCTCGAGPVIVGSMYRVGEVYVCEGAASEKEKANGPVKTAEDDFDPVVGFDLRGWEAADIQGLRGADGELDLTFAIMCAVDLQEAELRGADLCEAQLQGAILMEAHLQGANLSKAQLQGADLNRAQLQEANLGKAQLQGANITEAQLQRANLHGTQLQGAYLSEARLQGAILSEAQLQGAYLREAQLQGAKLNDAQLQGANLSSAELQGANLAHAWLQGTDLNRAQLQGANLYNADLSVLPKGSLLPKEGSATETEATKEDKPTDLYGANLSVLPKGSVYTDGCTVKVSEAARPTILAEVKASGAIFTYADLRGANFTSATLKDAYLRYTRFVPFRPPERPASGALSGSWKAKALLGGVARAAMAAGDDDEDEDSDDGSDDAGAEESPVEAKIEKVLDDSMDKLAAAAQGFMHTVDGMVGKVEELLKSSLQLLGSRKGWGSLRSSTKQNVNRASARLQDADSILAKLLCEKLQQVAIDKQAAIFEIVATHVVSPLFEKILPEVVGQARYRSRCLRQNRRRRSW